MKKYAVFLLFAFVFPGPSPLFAQDISVLNLIESPIFKELRRIYRDNTTNEQIEELNQKLADYYLEHEEEFLQNPDRIPPGTLELIDWFLNDDYNFIECVVQCPVWDRTYKRKIYTGEQAFNECVAACKEEYPDWKPTPLTDWDTYTQYKEDMVYPYHEELLKLPGPFKFEEKEEPSPQPEESASYYVEPEESPEPEFTPSYYVETEASPEPEFTPSYYEEPVVSPSPEPDSSYYW